MEKAFEDLKGETIISAHNHNDEEIVFLTKSGWKVFLNHYQDCCEHVRVEDISGSLEDLVGEEILMAEEVSDAVHLRDEDYRYRASDDFLPSCLWTFYKLATSKGYVTIRWLGESNGYYSVDVDCTWIKV